MSVHGTVCSFCVVFCRVLAIIFFSSIRLLPCFFFLFVIFIWFFFFFVLFCLVGVFVWLFCLLLFFFFSVDGGVAYLSVFGLFCFFWWIGVFSTDKLARS